MNRNTESLVRSNIAHAEALSKLGHYTDALTVLGETITNPSHFHSEHWGSQKLAKQARLALHMENPSSAVQYLAQIPTSHRRINPGLDALCLSIDGFLAKREGWKAWKNGDIDTGAVETLRAIRFFEESEHAALCAEDDLSATNAGLNILYTQGQLAAIQRAPTSVFETILTKMLNVEHQARQEMPPSKLDQMTGITMIAHVAHGIAITPNELFKLAVACDQQRIFETIVGNRHHDWDDLLIAKLRDNTSVRIEPTARLAILGANIIMKSAQQESTLPPEKIQMLRSYQVRLLDINLNIKTSPGQPNVIQKRITGLLHQTTKIVGGPPPSIRMFR